jgi:hypothetical protein
LKFIFLMQHSPSCLFFKGIASKAWQFIVWGNIVVFYNF